MDIVTQPGDRDLCSGSAVYSTGTTQVILSNSFHPIDIFLCGNKSNQQRALLVSASIVLKLNVGIGGCHMFKVGDYLVMGGKRSPSSYPRNSEGLLVCAFTQLPIKQKKISP